MSSPAFVRDEDFLADARRVPFSDCRSFRRDLLKQANDISCYGALVRTVVARLAGLPQTIGIVSLGGLGLRAHIDMFSDLDLAVFVSDDTPFLPPFSFVCPVLDRTVEFNISQHILSTQHYDWEPDKRSAYRRGLILYDPRGAVAALLTTRLGITEDLFQATLIEALNQIYWRGIRHSRASAARGSLASAHQLINDALRHVREALFALNKIEPPHTKWDEIEIAMLDRLPDHIIDKIAAALVTRRLDLDELERRAGIVECILADLTELAATVFASFPSDPYLAWARDLSGRQVRRLTVVDQLCDRLAGKLPAGAMTAVRGALAMALMGGPATLDELVAIVRSDGLIPPDVLHRMTSAIATIAPVVVDELEADLKFGRHGGRRDAG